MSSRKHEFTKGAVRRLLGAKKFRVTYRGRTKGPEDAEPGEWQVPQIEMIVPLYSDDPSMGRKKVDERIRFMREKYGAEVEVHKIEELDDEVPVQTVKDQVATAVSEKEYEGAKRKSALVYPGHPDWPGN